jgi:hypothetical protein
LAVLESVVDVSNFLDKTTTMQQYNQQLCQELLRMLEEDRSIRDELAADGSLYDGYHPRMEAVHHKNATRLITIIEQYGWPGRSLVGEDGTEAAWRIVQHSIGNPDLQRHALKLLKKAAAEGETPLWQVAMLEDRIRMLEGRPQIYGTQFDWDENGEMSPHPAIADPEQVDERRRAVGLGPLAQDIERRRAAIAQANERPPIDLAERERLMEEWTRSVGRRK